MTTPSEAADSIDAAAKAAASVDPQPHQYMLTNGIVLGMKAVPPVAIREAVLSVKQPEVPIVFNKDKERDEPNPNDPDFLAATKRAAFEQLYRLTDTLMLLGTHIVSLPDDIWPPDSEEWVERLQVLQIALPNMDNKYARYLAWLRLYAITTELDAGYIIGYVTSLSGVTEVEVQRAAAAFRDRSRR